MLAQPGASSVGRVWFSSADFSSLEREVNYPASQEPFA